MGALCLASLAYGPGGRGRLVGETPHPRSRESFFGGEKSREVGACAGRGLGGSGAASRTRSLNKGSRGHLPEDSRPGIRLLPPPRGPWALAWGSHRGGGRNPLTSAGLRSRSRPERPCPKAPGSQAGPPRECAFPSLSPPWVPQSCPVPSLDTPRHGMFSPRVPPRHALCAPQGTTAHPRVLLNLALFPVPTPCNSRNVLSPTQGSPDLASLSPSAAGHARSPPSCTSEYALVPPFWEPLVQSCPCPLAALFPLMGPLAVPCQYSQISDSRVSAPPELLGYPMVSLTTSTSSCPQVPGRPSTHPSPA